MKADRCTSASARDDDALSERRYLHANDLIVDISYVSFHPGGRLGS
jgi:hypothetical protein